MPVIAKAAAGLLTAAILLSGGATGAFANEPVAGAEETVAVEETATVITQADVDAAKAAFKQAQNDARISEKQARAAAAAEEKAQLALIKKTKGTAKKAAQKQLQIIRKANHAELKSLVSSNRAAVNAAKSEYQQIAAAFEAQENAAL
jgi:hypothetical protein